MALKNYIFIFLFLFFGLIESLAALGGSETGPWLYPSLESTPGGGSFPGSGTVMVADCAAGPDTVGSLEPVIVINELMVDPTPVVGLPDREYIELHNPGTGTVSLKGWVLGIGTKLKTLPDVSVAPGGYLLLTATGGAKDMQAFGRVTEVSGLTLANSGVTVSISDTRKVVMDQVDYLPSMHKSQCKDGGFSLERIDPARLCGQFYNWETTLSSTGGTPGAMNSVRAFNPDRTAPVILSTAFINGSILEIQFSERFQFPGKPLNGLLNLPSNAVVDSIALDQNACMMRICFRPSTILDGINYSLVLHGLEDECGNRMADQSVKFGYYNPVESDILISEVLFNPYPDGSDFVEIYNNCIHDVDLSGLFLATRGDDGLLKQITQLSSKQEYLAPGSYLAITKSIEGVERFYTLKCPECLLQTSKFPTLADESGCVVLLGRNQEVLDEMVYDDKMHHPFITEKEGIALEKIKFSVPSGKRGNWQSAAESYGFATPGYRNSVQEVPDSAGNDIIVEPSVFSPDGDGIHDRLTIFLNDVEPGEIINAKVLDAEGREVRSLANNLTTGSSDKLEWDGSDSAYRKVQPGIYVLYLSLFHPNGKHRTIKFACVLTDRP